MSSSLMECCVCTASPGGPNSTCMLLGMWRMPPGQGLWQLSPGQLFVGPLLHSLCILYSTVRHRNTAVLLLWASMLCSGAFLLRHAVLSSAADVYLAARQLAEQQGCTGTSRAVVSQVLVACVLVGCVGKCLARRHARIQMLAVIEVKCLHGWLHNGSHRCLFQAPGLCRHTGETMLRPCTPVINRIREAIGCLWWKS